MKRKLLQALTIALSVVTLNVFAHGGDEDMKINSSSSSIHWVGKKVTGQHEGNVNFKSGYLRISHGEVVDGLFVVDMTTINATDLEGEKKQNLNGQ